MQKKINGGYYIKARCIQNSEISVMPPYIREIWDWLLKEANHSDNKSHGVIIKRGQLVRTFKDIQEGLKWMIGYRKMTYKKWQCENSMRFLRKRGMVTTMRTTRGMLITICNYSHYQDPENYESNLKAVTRTTVNKRLTDTINKNDKNVKNDKKKKESVGLKPNFVVIINYLNEKTGRSYSAKNDSTLDLLRARFNEGRTVKDFITVIDKKVEDWLTDDKMNRYLRPSTLFNRTNFENYLNEPKEDKYAKYYKKE